MKKLQGFFVLLAVMLVSSLAFVACSDDDDDTPSSKDKIVGTWIITHTEGWEKEDGKKIEEWDEDVNDGTKMKFDSDGIVYHYEGSSVETAKWSKKGNKLTLTYYDEGDTFDQIVTIKTLTDEKLVVEVNESAKEDGVKYEYHEVTTMSRYSN